MRKPSSGAMDSVRKQLVEGEEIVHAARVHWAVFLYPGVLVVIAALVGVFFHWLVGAVIALMSLYPVINAVIIFFTTRLVLTNKRVLARYGFFNKDNIQLKLSRIESAHMEEPFIGQILGYGTVMINGTGTGTIPIGMIADAGAFVKKLEKITLAGENP